MKCPACETTTLVLAERQGVEIDYCPDCRGVWLDRGELDKIIDRATPAAAPAEPARDDLDRDRYRDDDRDRRRDDDDRDRYDDRDRGGKKRRKESFLGDLFDFG